MFKILLSSDIINNLWKVIETEIPFAIWETMYVTILSTFFAVIIGLPLGILLVTGQKNNLLPIPTWLMHLLNAIINFLRSVPFLILMIMVFPLSRLIIGTTIGTTATIIPLVVASFPFVARLIESSISEINKGLIEASISMGASPMQTIIKVILPECLPSIISDITITITTILSYSAMSGIIGGGGLGKIAINYGYYRYNYPVMIVAVILLVIIVQLFQLIGTFLSKKLDKRIRH